MKKSLRRKHYSASITQFVKCGVYLHHAHWAGFPHFALSILYKYTTNFYDRNDLHKSQTKFKNIYISLIYKIYIINIKNINFLNIKNIYF